MIELKRVWQFSILAGSLLLISGISVPRPSGKTPLSFVPTGHKAADESGKRQTLQSTADSGVGHLSEPNRNVTHSPALRFDRHPIWAHGYVAQLAGENYSSDVVVYDREGKEFSSAHVAIPGKSVTILLTAVPTVEGDAVVSGHAIINPGSTFFLAKTSKSGGVVSVIPTENFEARGICEESDHTIWTLGRDTEKEKTHDYSYSLVEQYSFERGLLHGYLSKADAAVSNTQLLGADAASKYGGFLACGKERVSLFLNETNEYMEIDPSTGTIKRWKMQPRPLPEGMAAGLAVTGEGRVYVSLFEDQHTETDWRFRRALFELRLAQNSSSGKWSLVSGTFSSSDPYNIPDGIFFKLWGADGEDLVIRRLHEADMSWVRVIP